MAKARFYLAPESSLELIRYLRSTNGEDGLTGKPVRKKQLNDAINTARAMKELDETAQRWLSHVSDPVHAFVAERKKGTSTKHLVTHVFGQQVPNGAFLDLGHGICVCSAPLMLMGVSAKTDTVEAISIGMELCGSYSKWSIEPDQMGDPYYLEHSEVRSCTYGLPPLANVRRVEAFVERMSGIRGSAAAAAALRWVLDDSASMMETAVYMLLCLPRRLGGYGLPKPTMNPKLLVSTPDGMKERYPDLFWLGANVDVEYNSDAEHSGEWSRYRDSKREVELTVANVKVLPLTRLQVMNADEFDSFAQGLRRMLGVRSRPLDSDWVERRDRLRAFLFAAWE
ncbi:MAG: hypothetical protein IJH04_02900 [Eggerthellaceae bacterium]|nr:hypothetical protein [Eggerthellaceae bacterium]